MIRILFLLACSLLVLPLRAQEIEDLDSDCLGRMEEALTLPNPASAAAALFDATQLAHGQIEPLLEVLKLRLDAHPDPAARIPLLELQAALEMRYGQLEAALGSTQECLGLAPTVERRLQEASLLDALDRRQEALESLEQALADLAPEDPRTSEAMLRRALLTMGDQDAEDALANFARSDYCSEDLRNRAAVILALLNRPGDAVDLFQVQEGLESPFRQHIRMAEWALEAKNAGLAQEWAWSAREHAVLRRDRLYALTVLSEAHRLDDSLDRLLEAFEGEEELDEESYRTWLELLRETGDYETVMRLYAERLVGAEDQDPDTARRRRQLLEFYREAGREEEMVQEYGKLIEAFPDSWFWREGLSRYWLEQGREDLARETWKTYLDQPRPGLELISAAEAMRGLGFDDFAIRCAELCIESDRARFAALNFLFDLHRLRGQLEQATEALERMDQLASADSPVRMSLSESFERIGNLERAVEVLENLRSSRGEEELSEDLEMRLAWLHSEVGNEEVAMERWHALWRRVDSVPRRRYVEDRLMTVASRLGRLADIAIELEGKLQAGTADKRDSGLLVRLYTRVGDSVSATEILDEFLSRSGGSEVQALEEKARVFMACTDFHQYETTVRRLIEVDPENEPDYLQQIAMSMLERGKPKAAKEVLARLRELDRSSTSAEFEAGVLALAGLREEAVAAYRRGLVHNPNRIESYLLLGALHEELGKGEQAIGMYQHLAQTAEKDDLFMIAIDGLLNLEAPATTLAWARRATLLRLATRHDKVYLYQLLADLAEQLNDNSSRMAALQNSLAIAGDRRTSTVRELMDLNAGHSDFFFGPSIPEPSSQSARHMAYGRRLLGLGQLVPPQVYLDLGRTFLSLGQVEDALKTFQRASELPEYDAFRREVATLLQTSSYLEPALRTYRQVLIGDSSNVSLLVKVAELEEQVNTDADAYPLYRRALELMLSRRPLRTDDLEGDQKQTFRYWGSRNVDEIDRYFDRAFQGLRVTIADADIEPLLEAQAALVREEMALAAQALDEAEEPMPLNRFPRLFRRVDFLRRFCLSFGRPAISEALDIELLQLFRSDEDFLQLAVRERLRWGLLPGARKVLQESGHDQESIDRLGWLVGLEVQAENGNFVSLDEALRLVLPMVLEERYEDARLLLRRVDFANLSGDRTGEVGALFSVSSYLEDPDLALHLGRTWLNLQLNSGQYISSWTVGPTVDRVGQALGPKMRRSFYQYFAQLLLEKPDEMQDLLALLPPLQEQLGDEKLIPDETLLEMLQEHGLRMYYQLLPVLLLLPEETRVDGLRSVWSQLSPSMRNWFLSSLLGEEALAEIGEACQQQILEWTVRQVKENKLEPDQLSYLLQSLTSEEAGLHAPELVRDILAELRVLRPEEPLLAYAESGRLLREGDPEGAVDALFEVFFSQAVQGNEDDWSLYSLRHFVRDKLFPLAPERFLDRYEAMDRQSKPSERDLQQRLNSLGRNGMEAFRTRHLQHARELFPENLGFAQQLHSLWAAEGESDLAATLLESMKEEFGEDVEFRRWLFYRERGMGQYPEALHALQQWQELVEEPRSHEADAQTEPAESASQPALRAAMEEGRFDDAQSILRRLWRSFQVGDDRYYYLGPRDPVANWIPDETPPSEEEEARREKEGELRALGGLLGFLPSDRQADEVLNGWEVLAEHEFATEEMRRYLRSREGHEVRHLVKLLDGLARSRVREHGLEDTVAKLLDKVVGGQAVNSELSMLLGLLRGHPESCTPEARKALDQMIGNLHPLDGSQLLRLANVMVAVGERELAIRLYRWCATLSSSQNYSDSGEGVVSSIDLNTLVRELRDSLVEGEDMVQVIEMALALSRPNNQPWEMRNYRHLVVTTWIDLLPPTEALERCRPFFDQIVPTENRYYQTHQLIEMACRLHAKAGEFEQATHWLGVLLGEDGDGRLGSFPFLIPMEDDEWVDLPGWLETYSSSLARIGMELDVLPHGWTSTLCLAVSRLDQLGRPEVAREKFQGLLPYWEKGRESDRLWLYDLARQLGQDEVAQGWLDSLLAEPRKLRSARLLRILRELRDAGDSERVLAIGEQLRGVRESVELQELMAEVAQEAGQADLAQAWSDRLEANRKALAEIEAWEEAEEAKRAGVETMQAIRIR